MYEKENWGEKNFYLGKIRRGFELKSLDFSQELEV